MDGTVSARVQTTLPGAPAESFALYSFAELPSTVLGVLRLTPDVRDQMFAHALRGLPHEACGMFSTVKTIGLVDLFHPMRNAAESAELFELDGQEMLDLERQIENSDRVLTGVMHSHTTTSPYPSPTDVRDCARFDPFAAFHHVIVSLRHAEPALRCFTITGERITEVPVIVTDGVDKPRDDGGQVAIATVMPLPHKG